MFEVKGCFVEIKEVVVRIRGVVDKQLFRYTAALTVVFVDYRHLKTKLNRLHRIRGNILDMPFADNNLQSLSYLHVADHFSLGCYGDPLNPRGTRQACAELKRVLAPEAISTSPCL
jgi:hypothetical protein